LDYIWFPIRSILMDVAQLFRFMQGVIFRPFYCDK
jgi:hypothetical protein